MLVGAATASYQPAPIASSVTTASSAAPITTTTTTCAGSSSIAPIYATVAPISTTAAPVSTSWPTRKASTTTNSKSVGGESTSVTPNYYPPVPTVTPKKSCSVEGASATVTPINQYAPLETYEAKVANGSDASTTKNTAYPAATGPAAQLVGAGTDVSNAATASIVCALSFLGTAAIAVLIM